MKKSLNMFSKTAILVNSKTEPRGVSCQVSGARFHSGAGSDLGPYGESDDRALRSVTRTLCNVRWCDTGCSFEIARVCPRILTCSRESIKDLQNALEERVQEVAAFSESGQ